MHRYRHIPFQWVNRNDYKNEIDKLDIDTNTSCCPRLRESRLIE
jgi:hypothetical protein